MAVSCTPRQPKTLVAYFSATGTTKAAAEDLARVAGADLLAITPAVPYTDADLNWRDSLSRSSLEMKDLTSRPALASTEVDIAAYDRVFIGFPIWWYTAPTVINTFIESLPLAGKQVALFATSGGSTIERLAPIWLSSTPTSNGNRDSCSTSTPRSNSPTSPVEHRHPPCSSYHPNRRRGTSFVRPTKWQILSVFCRREYLLHPIRCV